MPELKLNGKTYSGSTNYASAIAYVEEDGSKTTVQDKISEQNKNFENKNIPKFCTVELTLPSSDYWLAIPLPNGWVYEKTIVIGCDVDGIQTPVVNNAIQFEIATINHQLCIIPRNSFVQGKHTKLVLISVDN